MQLAAIEIARNLIGIEDAVMEEFKTNSTKIIKRIHNNQENLSDSKITIENVKKTMWLGSYTCNLVPNTVVANIYGELKVNERHRHRYKFNNDFQDIFEKNGVKFSGFSEDKEIVEAIELPKLLWFVGVQFHLEFKSKPFEAHPLFTEFIKAAINYKKNVNFV